MKKIAILLPFLLLSSYIIAQPASLLQPIHVEWQADNNNIFLATALKKGIQTPDSLSLILFFSKEDVKKAGKQKSVELEFQWYRYASTTRFFVQSKKVTASPAYKNGKYYIAFKSGMTNLRRGWWEVQVISYSDNGFISYQNSEKFQILLK